MSDDPIREAQRVLFWIALAVCAVVVSLAWWLL